MLDIAALAKLGGVKKYNADEIFNAENWPEMFIYSRPSRSLYNLH